VNLVVEVDERVVGAATVGDVVLGGVSDANLLAHLVRRRAELGVVSTAELAGQQLTGSSRVREIVLDVGGAAAEEGIGGQLTVCRAEHGVEGGVPLSWPTSARVVIVRSKVGHALRSIIGAVDP